MQLPMVRKWMSLEETDSLTQLGCYHFMGGKLYVNPIRLRGRRNFLCCCSGTIYVILVTPNYIRDYNLKYYIIITYSTQYPVVVSIAEGETLYTIDSVSTNYYIHIYFIMTIVFKELLCLISGSLGFGL